MNSGERFEIGKSIPVGLERLPVITEIESESCRGKRQTQGVDPIIPVTRTSERPMQRGKRPPVASRSTTTTTFTKPSGPNPTVGGEGPKTQREQRKGEGRKRAAQTEVTKAREREISTNVRELGPNLKLSEPLEELPTLDARIDDLLSSDRPLFITGFPPLPLSNPQPAKPYVARAPSQPKISKPNDHVTVVSTVTVPPLMSVAVEPVLPCRRLPPPPPPGKANRLPAWTTSVPPFTPLSRGSFWLEDQMVNGVTFSPAQLEVVQMMMMTFGAKTNTNADAIGIRGEQSQMNSSAASSTVTTSPAL